MPKSVRGEMPESMIGDADLRAGRRRRREAKRGPKHARGARRGLGRRLGAGSDLRIARHGRDTRQLGNGHDVLPVNGADNSVGGFQVGDDIAVRPQTGASHSRGRLHCRK